MSPQRTPLKKKGRAVTPFSPSPASTSRSDASGTPVPFPLRAPLTKGSRSHLWFQNEQFRQDRRFLPLKKILSQSKDLLSFERDSELEDGGYWRVVAYPLNNDGTRVPVEELTTFISSHFWDAPRCMCSIRDGADHITKFFIPSSRSSQESDCFGKLCLACPYSACPYFVSITDLVIDNEDLTVGHCSHHFIFGPEIEEVPTPKLEKGKGRAMSSAASSPAKAPTFPKLEAGAASPSKKAPALFPKPEPGPVGNIFQSGVLPYLSSPAKASGSTRIKSESPGNIFQQADRSRRKRQPNAQTKSSALTKKSEPKDNIPEPVFEPFRANIVEFTTTASTEVTWDRALTVLLRLFDPKDSGVSNDELAEVVYHCRWCNLNISQTLVKEHICILDITSDSGIRALGETAQRLAAVRKPMSIDSDSDDEIVQVANALLRD